MKKGYHLAWRWLGCKVRLCEERRGIGLGHGCVRGSEETSESSTATYRPFLLLTVYQLH